MSHLTEIKTEIKDPDAIRAAARALSLPVRENHTARFYYGESAACDFVIVAPGMYDLGFSRQANGIYHLVCDEEVLSEKENDRNRDIRAALGPKAGRFFQEYHAAVAEKQARLKGYRFNRAAMPDGSLRLTLSGRLR